MPHLVPFRARFRFAAVAALLAAALACAQPQGIEPSDIDGRTFHGLRLPLAVTPGEISFTSARAYSWKEESPPLPDGKPGVPVQRLLLTGDVKTTLGQYAITATRAAVWLSPLRPDDPDAAPGVWQVWMYLERGGSAVHAGGIKITGDKLPVQGIIKTTAGIGLRADRLEPGRPADPFVAEAERALATRLRNQLRGEAPPPRSPEEFISQGLPVPPLVPRQTDAEAEQERRMIAEAQRRLPPYDRPQPIFAEDGIFSFVTGGDIKIVGGGGEDNAVVFENGITVGYWQAGSGRTLQLTAERAVVFLAPGSLPELAQLARTEAKIVRGIYLEGDVIADVDGPRGHYTLRSPKVFYSVVEQRAMLVDAVFWTYDARRGMPLYVRAKTIEQESADQFKATRARLSNSGFYDPDLSVGASTVTILSEQEPEGERRVTVDARDVTLRAGGVPFFYWPRISGDPQTNPLRDLRLENSSGSGAAVKTTWDAYNLFRVDAADGNSSDLLLDWYFDRGAAFGTYTTWRNPTANGGIFGYLVPVDHGRDVLVTGEEKDAENATRGMILIEHRAAITDEWTLFLEGAYISDETFVDGYFEPLARTRREFTNSAYLRRLHDNTIFSAQAKANFNDFISNQYLIQSPGYTVEKYPDVGYARLADDLLEDHPGLLTYSSEYRLTQMRLNFSEVTPRDLGYSRPGQSQALFNIGPDESFADALRAQGYSESPVTRFDTRHELTMPLMAGPVNITPFLTGRFTAYNDDFDTYASGEEPYRLWASQGVRFSTEIQRVDNSVSSRLLDLNRIRHIVRPTMTFWHADSTIDRVNLPVYDDEVESLAEGTAVRMAIDQTWQTQRGGPGRWRSVDVFRFNAELVVSSGDVDRESPVGRYFDFRPEYSNLGDTFATLDTAWQVTEVLGIGANMVYDFDINQPARTNFGITLEHNPYFTTYLDLRFLNAQDSRIFIFGGSYQLTRKYTVSGHASYDIELGDIQSVGGEVRRLYPNVLIGLGVNYNNITSETSFGFVFQPVGISRGGGAQIRGLGSNSVTSAAGG